MTASDQQSPLPYSKEWWQRRADQGACRLHPVLPPLLPNSSLVAPHLKVTYMLAQEKGLQYLMVMLNGNVIAVAACPPGVPVAVKAHQPPERASVVVESHQGTGDRLADHFLESLETSEADARPMIRDKLLVARAGFDYASMEAVDLVPVPRVHLEAVVQGTGEYDYDPAWGQYNRYRRAVAAIRKQLTAQSQPTEAHAERAAALETNCAANAMLRTVNRMVEASTVGDDALVAMAEQIRAEAERMSREATGVLIRSKTKDAATQPAEAQREGAENVRAELLKSLVNARQALNDMNSAYGSSEIDAIVAEADATIALATPPQPTSKTGGA